MAAEQAAPAAGRGVTERLRSGASRAFPRSPLDLLVQFAIIAAAYYAWRYARGAVDGSTTESVRNALDLVSIEGSLGLFFEHSVQHWATAVGWPLDFANWMYLNAHFKGSLLALGAIYFLRNDSFGFVRNMLLCAMAISLLGYGLFPTAPPRFAPGLDIRDTVSAVTGNPPIPAHPDALFNPYAAVPSMHIGFSLMWGVSLALLFRPWWLRGLFLSYPLVMTYVVVATGNHFWIDGSFGALAAALAAGCALALSRLRPERWSFHPRLGGEPVGARRPEVEAAPA